MKKLIFGLTMLAIAATTTFVACKKDEVKKEQVSTPKANVSNLRVTTGLITDEEMDKILALSSDSTFRALVRIKVKEFNNTILNATRLKTLLSTEMTAAKIPAYAIMLGYSSTEDFLQTTSICKNLEAELEDKYQLSAMKVDHVNEAIYLVDSELPGPPLSMAASKPAHCTNAYNSTVNAIRAEAALLHVGCIYSDLTIIAGIICHSLVTVWAINSYDAALATYHGCS